MGGTVVGFSDRVISGRGELGLARMSWAVGGSTTPTTGSGQALRKTSGRLTTNGGGGGLEPLNWLGCQGWFGCGRAEHGAGSRPRTPGWRRGRKTGGSQTRPYAGLDEGGGGWFDTARRRRRTGSPRTVSWESRPEDGRVADAAPTLDRDGNEDGGRREGEIPRGTVGMTARWFDTGPFGKLRAGSAKDPGPAHHERGNWLVFARMSGLMAWRAEALARGWDAGIS